MNPRLPIFALTLLSSAALTGHCSAQALTLVTSWNFNNNAVAVNTSPAASTGTGTASTLGFNSTYNSQATPAPANSNSVDTSDVNTSTPLSSDPGAGNTQWRLRGGDGTTGGNTATGNNGWSSFAPIGSQGAQFLASTAGYTGIKVSFDWSPTAQGEGKLQLQYTLNGTTFFNVPISLFTSLGTGATATPATNTTSANTVTGGYLNAGSSTTYMNGITADLSSIGGAANDPNFGIRMVNAATGADDTNVAGAALNNTSGNWRFDEVNISGTMVPEPGTCALVGFGLAALALSARRSRKIAV